MKQIYTTTLRLNLDNEEDRRAYEHLRQLDKRQYRSVNRAIVAAVNGYFGRQKQLAADPYLETREKEDAFLQEIRDTIRRGLQEATPTGLIPLLQLIQGAAPASPASQEEDSGDMDAALDFADSF